MSVIRASVIDQRLKITEAPIVASGGLNETKVAFTFCEKWNGFTKTATFYRDESEVYSIPLDANDTCVVPWEVCNESGSFYIGVYGEKAGVRRTSTTARYKVKRGAAAGGASPSNAYHVDCYNTTREELGAKHEDINTEYILGLYDALVAMYPNKIKKNEVHNDDGSFTNYEYVISTGEYNTVGEHIPRDEDIKKPKYLIMSGVHGREQSAIISTYKFVCDVLSGHNIPSHFREGAVIHVLPVAVPYTADNNCRTNENGVNIERNFDWNWRESTTAENGNGNGSGDYAGSELETQVIAKWLNDNRDAELFIDVHNSGFINEIANILGLEDHVKRLALRGLDRVVPYWKNVLKLTEYEMSKGTGDTTGTKPVIYAYSSNYNPNGTAYCYATDKLGIPGICLELSAHVDGKNSELYPGYNYDTNRYVNSVHPHKPETHATGAEAIGNIVIEFYRSIADAKLGDIETALDSIIAIQNSMLGGEVE